MEHTLWWFWPASGASDEPSARGPPNQSRRRPGPVVDPRRNCPIQSTSRIAGKDHPRWRRIRRLGARSGRGQYRRRGPNDSARPDQQDEGGREIVMLVWGICNSAAGCLMARRITEKRGTDVATMRYGRLDIDTGKGGVEASILGRVAYAVDLKTGHIRDMRQDANKEISYFAEAPAPRVKEVALRRRHGPPASFQNLIDGPSRATARAGFRDVSLAPHRFVPATMHPVAVGGHT